MRRILTTVLASAATLAGVSSAGATGLLNSLWPASDAEIGAVTWSGYAISPDIGYESFSTTGAGGASFDDLSGFLLGGQVSVDTQFNGFVLGARSTGQIGFADETGTGAAAGTKAELHSYGTISARAGIAYGRFLVYGIGGAAFADLEIGGDSQTLSGWLAGGGLEYAWNTGTFLRLEYTRVELDGETFGSLTAPDDGVGLEADMFDVSLVRKFSW